MVQWQEITCENGSIKEIDANIKNCFHWRWLEQKDCDDYFLSDYLRKVNIPGKVVCSLCKKS